MRSVLLATLLLGGCLLATSPEDAERDDLPAIGEDGDEFHRPGQPCTLCHGFALAGTIYRRATDADGVEGAEILVTDDNGRELVAHSNRVGNFFVEVSDDRDRARPGQTRVPWKPEFPLRIEVRLGELEQTMESYAWREGSCAGCHTGSADTGTSVRKVFLDEAGAP